MLAITNITLGSAEAAHFSISSLECFGGDSGWRGLLTMRSGSFAVIDHTFYFDDLPEFRDRIRSIYKSTTAFSFDGVVADQVVGDCGSET